MPTLILLPEEHFGRTYDEWTDVPFGHVVHVHGKGFYIRLHSDVSTIDLALYTAQVNGPTDGWMQYPMIPRGPFVEVNRISYAGT